MRRVGSKGSGQFERISCNEALDTIAERFTATIAEFGAEAIMPCSYLGHEGLLNGLTIGVFTAKIGLMVEDLVFNNYHAGIQQLLSQDRQFSAPGSVNQSLLPLVGDYSVILLDGDRQN